MNPGYRVRIKGTSAYVDQAAFGIGHNGGPEFRAESVPAVKNAPMGVGSYTTTGTGLRSSRFRSASLGPNAALDGAARTLRNQSRELQRKNPIAASVIERVASNTVGTGIRPRIPDKAIRKLWNLWTDEASADGQLDLYGLQGQIITSVVTAGECFVRFRLRKVRDGMRTVPLQLEVLEPEFVPHEKNEVALDGGVIRQGVQFHPEVRSRRVGYWMHQRHPDDADPSGSINEPRFVPASEVLHIYLPTRPGQVRGEPWLARIIDRLIDLDQYDKAEIVRKKTAALFSGFIRKPLPEGLTPEELQDLWGDDSAEVNDGIGDITLDPGSMHMLQPGEDITFSQPSDVGEMYDVFKNSHYRDIAASVGLLYEQVTGDYSKVNDRTWRAAFNEFRRRCECWQHHLMAFQFCRPVAERWLLILGIAPGMTKPAVAELRRPSLDAELPEPWLWTPPRWPYINPLQDIEALTKERLAGLNSRKAQAAERGDDVEVLDEENAEDVSRSDGKGLIYTSDPIEGVSTKVPPPAADAADDGDGGTRDGDKDGVTGEGKKKRPKPKPKEDK